MAEQLEIAESLDADALVLSVSGELDIATARLLDIRLRELLEKHRKIVLDLGELSFIDSTGLAVLVTAAQDAQNDGGGFAVRSVSPSAQRVLELSGVAAKLRLLPDQP
jgi:anti-anti-sigma factor